MANDTSINPWVIDTASAIPITTDVLRIARIRWVGASAAGHQAVLKDKNGKVVYESVANGANFVEDKPLAIRVVFGLACTTLGSGKLYLEFE